MDKSDVEKAFEMTQKENASNLGEILMADFMMHLATTTLALVLKDSIAKASTPEEKNNLKTIPDQIVTGWAESRRAALATQEEYFKIFSKNEKSLHMSPEQLTECVKKFADDEKKVLDELVANLRRGFSMITKAL